MANFFEQFDGVAEVTPPTTQQSQRNFFEQFDPPGAAASPTSTAGAPQEQGNYFAQFDPPKADAPHSKGFVAGLVDGFKSGIFEQHPETGSQALEMASHLAPDSLKEPLKSGSDYLRSVKREGSSLSGIRLRDVYDKNGEGFTTWAGETIGGGIASTIPPIVTGAAGAAVGSQIAPGIGTVVGGTLGSTVSGYPMNGAEVYMELKKNGVEPARAAQVASIAAIPMAMLDAIPAAWALSKFGGLDAVKKEVARGLARRLAAEAAKGGSLEAVTETTQQFVNQAAQKIEAGAPLGSADNVWDLVEAGAAGALTGGVLGGASGIQRDRVAPKPTSVEELQRGIEEFSGAKKVGATAGAEAVPAPTEKVEGVEAAPIAVEPGPTFFSQVTRVAEQKLPESFTSAQMEATLRNSPGIKPEELDWLQIPEFAKDHEGKISKKELLTHLEDKAIQIEDVAYGSGQTSQTTLVQQELSPIVDEDGNTIEAQWSIPEARGWGIQKIVGVDRAGDPDISFDLYNPQGQRVRSSATLEEAQGALNRVLSPPNETTYESWQAVKGGENYRERLLRFQNKQTDDRFTDADSIISYQSPHFDPDNVVAHYRTADFVDVTGQKGMLVQEIQSDWHQEGRKKGYNTPLPRKDGSSGFGGVPNAPFKTNWSELAVKRILRQAADEGYSRVYLAPGSAQVELYRQMGENAEGQQEFYDQILPRIFGKWAKKLGGKVGKTEVVTPTGAEPVFYIDITPQMASAVQRGLPMFAYTLEGLNKHSDVNNYVPGTEAGDGISKTGINLAPVTIAGTKIIQEIAAKLGMKTPIFVRLVGLREATGELKGAGGFYQSWHRPETKELAAHVINVVPGNLTTEASVIHTLAHELGHAIQKEKFHSADAMTQLMLVDAWHKDRQSWAESGVRTLNQLVSKRGPFMQEELFGRSQSEIEIASLSPERQEYWLGFNEWFAENVAKWMTTSETALTTVEKFFASIARALRSMYAMFIRKTGMTAEANLFVTDFLESLAGQQLRLDESIEASRIRTKKRNENVLRRAGYGEHPASEMTLQTAPGRKLIAELGLSEPALTQANAVAAQADHYSKWWKWGLSVIQLAERNAPDPSKGKVGIPSLFRYKEMWQQKTLERQEIMDGKLTVLKAWKNMGKERSDKLGGLIDDYVNLEFLTSQEKAANVVREATDPEIAQLAHKNGVDVEGIQLFKQIQGDFKNMLQRYTEVANVQAMKISDIHKRNLQLRANQQQFDMLNNSPYFPMMRFGDLTIEVLDGANELVAFHTFESERARKRALEQLKTQYPQSGGYTVKSGKLPADTGPLIGLPPGFLDLVAKKLTLSNSQQQSLELLRFSLSPAGSFKHRFERKKRTPGYSLDFQRAYANYFFHGSNYLTRIKYMDDMRQVVYDLREESRAQINGTKRMQIADFVEDHLNYMLDPKADWSTLRALTFLWALGFSPAAALLNTTQIAIGSYPILAQGFGDLKSVAALMKAGANIATYYKQASLKNLAGQPNAGFQMRAIAEAMKEGVISEAMAPELAALSEGNNLQGIVGNAFHQFYMKTMEKSGWMFEQTEQWNRRVTFRAALNLALENPTAKYVDEAVSKNEDQYQRLRKKGWSERETRAFVTAKYATESTQYIYGQYAQPRLMRGKLRTIFIFKSFVQNTLFMLWNNPGAAARSLLVMAALGGLMGLPGMEDMKGIIKLLGKKLLGADWDVDDEARRFAVDVLGGKISPDLLLHGMSRYGMGIPQVMNWVGIPAPVMDMSRSVSMGNILPIDLNSAFGGGVRPERNMLDTAQRASGAAFGIGFNIWKAINDSQQDVLSFSRLTKTMPREMQALSRFYQAYRDGSIKNRSGTPIVRFDPNDTRHMAELILMAGGWQPLRLTAQWDRIIAEREAIDYWNGRRGILLQQYYHAHRTGQEGLMESAKSDIAKFNTMVLKTEARGMAITGDTLRRSVSTRSRLQALQEQGLPAQKSHIEIVREIQRLHPEAQVDVRSSR